MTTLPRGTERVFAVMVTGKAEKFNGKGEPGFEVEVDGKAFDSQYPQKFHVPEDAGGLFKVGGAYNAVFASENLKKDKSGDKPWHYYWGFVRMDDGTGQAPKPPTKATAPTPAPAQPQQPPAPAPAPVRAPWEAGSDRETSIQRQVAAKCAVDLVIAFGASQETPLVLVTGLFDSYFNHIIARIEGQPAPEPQDAQP